MIENDISAWSPDDTLRILIASDIHLGFMENDPVRGEDSFIAFEEVLSLAVQCDVDLILLGGDLFDQAKPSVNCMFKCTEIIRKYCLGDKPVSIELLSDQIKNFSRTVNYEDPNLNISYPILSIHGNHDDPVGQGSVSSLDILSITGLVNYFGKWTDYTHVRISPVLLQKGLTRLALYGLSHLKDQRLSRLFAEKKVEMERPDETLDWFNLFVLHQNHADRGHSNYIPEGVLPNFLDLVVWGHEHDSHICPMKGNKTEKDSFFVVQPGSTVATSLAAGEALPKHCGLLEIHKGNFKLTPLPLQTVRPFIFKTIVLSEENIGSEDVNENEKVQEFLKNRVNEAIDEASKLKTADLRQPLLPLIRLSIFYERESQNFNRIRFGQNFNGLVANPNDLLIMKKEKKIREKRERDPEEEGDMTGVAAEAADVESLLRAYYEAQPKDKRLSVLSVRVITDAVRDFTLKHNEDVLRRAFDAHKRRCIAALLESTAETEKEIAEQLEVCKRELDEADDEKLHTLVDASARPSAPAAQLIVPVVKLPNTVGKRTIVVLSSDEEELSTRSGRGRTTRASRGKSPRGKSTRATKASAPAPSPPERRTPRRSAAQKSTSWLQNIMNSSRRRGSNDIENDSD
ncbi:double-strand break repair protein MRE11 [Bombyx mandarina]|uniref:Double-strand break repair protein n=1 Tax=Bombyx mandarina TaxID=7092 RepID=A0A6J2JEC5_BOMMA|nr:double-strand break repair protein MRE11 [Bombyx mandarina]